MNNLFNDFDLGAPLKKATDVKQVKKSVATPTTKTKQITNQNLFSESGLDEFNIELNKPKVGALLKKLNISGNETDSGTEADTAKLLKSNKVTIIEKLTVIKKKVLEVLGKQKKNIVVIRDLSTFDKYIADCIKSGKIAIDTETNNSTDTATCKLMGLCLYFPGGKQAYVPINHVYPESNERLADQLTEQDCRVQLQKLKDANTFVIMHNGKFDYEVIKSTCAIEVEPNWDTMIGAHTINENEKIGLKWQYIDKIDSTQEKYDIESLFTIPYKYVDPDTFALYAATDPMMTYKLYEYQSDILLAPGNEKLYWLFTNIEMPIVKVAADMELIGVCIDQEFGERLRLKFNQQLEDIDNKIKAEFEKLQPNINTWKLSIAATEKTKQFQPKKSKLSVVKLEERYPFIDQVTGQRYKVGKAKIEQLDDPINLASPTQLAILFYDILHCPRVSKKSPRGTGKDELEALATRTGLPLCKLILERRGVVKLISTYIDVLPALARHWPDGRIRYKLNSVGTDTGRFSSGGSFKFLDGDERTSISGFNSQNIPSRGDGKITRLLFKAKTEYDTIETSSNVYELPEISEIETLNGWKYGKDLVTGDILITDEGERPITNVAYSNKSYLIYV